MPLQIPSGPAESREDPPAGPEPTAAAATAGEAVSSQAVTSSSVPGAAGDAGGARATASPAALLGGAAEAPATRPSEGSDDGAAPPKRSPAEAFAELTATIHELRAELDEVGGFVHLCRDKLVRQADEHKAEGMRDVLDSMIRIHDLLFRQIVQMEAGSTRPDPFVLNLFQTVEAELATHGVEVIRPHPGDELNLEVMTTIGTAACPFWRRADRVAQVASCGFVVNANGARRVLRKSEITVYRK